MAKKVSGEVVIRINDAEVKNSINGVGKEIRRLKKEINDLDTTDKDYQKNLKKLSGELDAAKKKYGEMKDAVSGVGKETSKLPGILKGLGPMIVATFSVAAIAEFGRVLLQNLEIARKTKQELSQMTGQTGGRLNNNTSNVMALADTYKVESSEIIATTNALSKQLKIPFESAFNEIKKGFESGVNASGELLENIKEYAPFMNEAKVSASEMLKVLELQTKNGVFSDKLIDSVKEGSIRIGEGTKATRDAISGIGIDVDELYKKLEGGEMSRFQAIELIIGKMEELGDQSTKTRTAIADIFGGAGEDAGFENLTLLNDLAAATGNLSAESEEYIALKQKEFEANKKLNDVWVELSGTGGFLSNIMISLKLAVAEILPFLMKGSKLFWELSGRSQTLTNIWNYLKSIWETVTKVVDDLQAMFKQLLRELGLSDGQIKSLTGSLVNFLTWVWKQFDALYQLEKALKIVSIAFKGFAWLVSETVIQTTAFVKTIKEIGDAFSKIDFSHPIDSLNRIKEAILSFGKNKTEVQIEFDTNKARENAKKASEEMAGVLQSMLDSGSNKQEIGGLNGSGVNKSEIEKRQKEAEKARQEAERAAEAERKRREQIQKEIEQGEKQFYDNLLKQQRDAQDGRLELMNEGYAKEKAKIDTEFSRRIEDLKNQIKETEAYQKELQEKSQAEYKAGNVSGGDGFKKLAAEQTQIIAEKNATIQNLEKIHLLKLHQLYSEYQQKEIADQQKQQERLMMNMETRHNNELKSLTDLESAKQLLRDKGYSEEDLEKIKTLEAAKSEIILSQQQELLDAQTENLKTQIDEWSKLIGEEMSRRVMGGVSLFSDEELDNFLQNIEIAQNALSALNEGEGGGEKKKLLTDGEKEILSGIDLLGYTGEQWMVAFENLEIAQEQLGKTADKSDVLAAKLKLAGMAVGTLMNAFSQFYQMQNANIARDLQAFENAVNRKKSSLQKQLDQGYISQEAYNAKIQKLEADLEKKRAEAEYKQAMNEWKMQMIQAVGAMALGILNSLSYGGPVGFAFAAITAALGAFQIATLASNKPKKPSFAAGGYTSGLGYRDETGHEVAGTVHAGEYVTPAFLLEDPQIARMTEFIEARRLGMNPNQSRPEDGYLDGGPVQNNSTNVSTSSQNYNTALLAALNRLNENLENPVPVEAKLSRTLETAKTLLDDQEQYINHRNKNKR